MYYFIYTEWTLLPSLFGPVHSQYKVCQLVFFFILPCFVENPVFQANSVDPDQTPRSAASDLVCTVCQCPFYGTLGINGLTNIVEFTDERRRSLSDWGFVS